MKKKIIISIFIFLILTIYILTNSSLYLALRSYIVMYPYSYKHEQESILNKKNINFFIPSGASTKESDWYPFVMTFNDNEGFSKYTGKDLSLTVLYNFGHFQLEDGFCSYYNPNSPYYSSFYGGYVVYNNKNSENKFGFSENDEINVNEISIVPKYDQTVLVLPSLGCPKNKIIFESEIGSIEHDVSYIGIEGWVKIDSKIETNSPIHKYRKNYRGYLQYGKPMEKYYNTEDFPVVSLHGRIYAKYIDDYNMTFVLYILAPSEATIEECDTKILSNSIITK